MDAIDKIIESASEKATTATFNWNALRSACDYYDSSRLLYLRQKELYEEQLGDTGKKAQQKKKKDIVKKPQQKKKPKQKISGFRVLPARILYRIGRKKMIAKGGKGKKKQSEKISKREEKDDQEDVKVKLERLKNLCNEQKEKLIFMMDHYKIPSKGKIIVTKTADVSCLEKFRDWKGILFSPVMGLTPDATLKMVIETRAAEVGIKIQDTLKG